MHNCTAKLPQQHMHSLTGVLQAYVCSTHRSSCIPSRNISLIRPSMRSVSQACCRMLFVMSCRQVGASPTWHYHKHQQCAVGQYSRSCTGTCHRSCVPRQMLFPLQNALIGVEHKCQHLHCQTGMRLQEATSCSSCVCTAWCLLLKMLLLVTYLASHDCAL
jgi:hypothetical protein